MVRTTRKEIDVGLAIFLFCCTGGIGFIIYLIIYFSEPEDRCVFCGQKTIPFTGQEVTSSTNELYGQPQPSSSSSQKTNLTINYCPNCGSKADPDAKLCEICGTELDQ
ncbi:MAG: zinc-ribbon domain-containing protein [Candidatus Lokiarchaeota archaeon]|nr:zinc-ribbon domain-containing protein [Candidatus Lokiarchaeota archaeon]